MGTNPVIYGEDIEKIQVIKEELIMITVTSFYTVDVC